LPGVSSIDIGERSFSAHAHAEIGASLLALWALPLPIVEAVACHHAPSLLPLSEFGLHGIVHVASALANEYEPDLDFLAARGVEDRLPQWRAMANERPAHG
ncbi:MAG TPA: HDOD domain-containing protein, partial [Rudaea sp.]